MFDHSHHQRFSLVINYYILSYIILSKRSKLKIWLLFLLAPKYQCQHNNDCGNDEACQSGKCVKVCAEQYNSCARNALCSPNNHQAVCSCPTGMIGDPFNNCLKEPISAECLHDSECSISEACINKKCQNPCTLNQCAINSECRISFHRASMLNKIFFNFW